MSQEKYADYHDVKIDLREIAEQVRRNKEERLQFIEFFAKWVKKTPNSIWSKKQKDFMS